MLYNGKPVLRLTWRARIEEFACLNNVWRSVNYDNTLDDCNLIADTAKNIQNFVKNKHRTNLQQKDTLYFGLTSKFPRFKLSDSGLKRCIKPDKMDCAVIGNIELQEMTYWYVFEDEQYVYVMDNENVKNVYCRDSIKLALWMKDPIQYIKKYNLCYGSSNIRLLPQKTFTYCNSRAEQIDLQNILNGTYTSIITDKELDQYINKAMPVLTQDDVKSICELLDSPDNATKGLGLKMLFAYNVNETPLTVRTILGTREYLASLSEWNSVGVKQILRSVDWSGFGRFPTAMYNIVQPYNKTTYTKADLDLTKEVYLVAANNYMKDAIQRLDDSGILKPYGFNITYEIS